MSVQVLYVPPQRTTALHALYVRFDRDGQVKKISTNVPRWSSAIWIPIQKKEYRRLVSAHRLTRPVGRPILSASERHEHRRQSGKRYRDKVARRREEFGVPLRPVPRGKSASLADVQHVIDLLGQHNPVTGRAYKGVEIAILVGRSASFVSRVKHGSRRNVN